MVESTVSRQAMKGLVIGGALSIGVWGLLFAGFALASGQRAPDTLSSTIVSHQTSIP